MDEERVYRRLREENPAALEELMDEYWISVYQLVAYTEWQLGRQIP